MLNYHLIAKTRPVARKENIVLWGDIRVTVLTEGLFRIEKDTRRAFCDEATQSFWYRDTPAVKYKSESTGSQLTLITEKAQLNVRIDIMQSTVFVDGKEIILREIENLPGAYRSLDNCTGDIYQRKDEKYKIKLEDGIVSKCGAGFYDDTASLILAQDGRLRERNDDGLDLYVFAHGKDYRSALRDLFRVCGNVPLIPRYAFGNWWSRYHEYSDTEYLHILDKLAERDIPLTVATIDMDWHWSTTLDDRKKITESGKNDEFHGGANGWTGYSWNTDLFPDYKSFLKKIKERGLKITLNLHPADGIRYFEDMYEDMAEAMGVDPKTEQLIPFDFTSDRFINAYFDILHKPYERDGVEFWWIDWQQGHKSAMPGLDPLWALNHYHTLDNAREHNPLILSRYCGIGSHRYPLGFSGDTTIAWESLDYIPYFTAMGTNAGYTWWSHDIGGHMFGYKDDELYMRYVQFGVFSPINRLHCCAYDVVTKEPSVYMNGTGLIAEEFLRLRHRMIPFLYSASYETHYNGKALIEPMYYAYPDAPEAYDCPGQYLFADQLIVAPITQKGDSDGLACKKIWLPEGKWTDIFTGDEYDGGKWTEMIRWRDTIPVLAKEGAFFVLDGRRHTNNIDNPDALEVMIFNGNGKYVLHEDDGTDKRVLHTHFVSSAEQGRQTLKLSVDGDRTLVGPRTYRLCFRNIRKGAVTVYESGKRIVAEVDDAGESLELMLRNADSNSEYTVVISYENDRTQYRNARLLYNLMRFEGENDPKNKWYEKLIISNDSECRRMINEKEDFTQTQKKRLNEAW